MHSKVGSIPIFCTEFLSLKKRIIQWVQVFFRKVKPKEREADHSTSDVSEITIRGDIWPLFLYDWMDYKGTNFILLFNFYILSYLYLGLTYGLLLLAILTNCLCECLFYLAHYKLPRLHPSWFDHSMNNVWGLQFTGLSIMHFYIPVKLYLIPQYLRQHSVLEHTQHNPFPLCWS